MMVRIVLLHERHLRLQKAVSMNLSQWAIDPQIQALLQGAAQLPPLHELTVEEARERVSRLRGGSDGLAMHSVWDAVATGNVPVRVYQPFESRASGVIVYYHGGGWMLGGLDESDALCRAIAAHSGLEVVSVGYRLAPENPYPAPVDDAELAFRWVAEHMRPGVPVVVVGDSAGGNLATVVARRARDSGISSIVLQVLIYPVTDGRMLSSSYEEYYDAPTLLRGKDMERFWYAYAPGAKRFEPEASPLLSGSLRGLPDALVILAEHDVLRDEGIAYARRLSREGVDVTVDRYESMIHGFFGLTGQVTIADEAIKSVARAARTASQAVKE